MRSGVARDGCNENPSYRVERRLLGQEVPSWKVPTPRVGNRHSRTTKESRPLPAETHVEQSPLDRQAVLDLIRDRLSDILEIEPSGINEGDSFADDLEADSLALIELVEALEEELGERSVGFRIEDEDLEDLKTVRDAVDYVMGKLG